MRCFVYFLVCIAALASYSRAQWPSAVDPFNPGLGGPGHGHGWHHRPGAGGPVLGPVNPDPTRTEKCAKFWIEEGNSCYLFDSGAFLRQVAASGPLIVNNENGLFQAAANMYCGRMHPNASLVTVNSMAENNFLYEWAIRMMVEPEPVWIGLHVGPTGLWQWYSGEPITYTNWEGMRAPPAEPGLGAMIFDAEIVNQMFNNQVEIAPQWVPEEARNDRHSLICEYHPSDMTATTDTLTTDTPTTDNATTDAANTPPVATTPIVAATTASPVFFQNNPSSLVNRLTGGRFGGSLLHEIPRRQRNRPSNYKMNPYFGVQP